jgi:hypothetical protein
MPGLVPIVIIMLLTPLGGCTVAVQPDTLCQLPRPSARQLDTKGTQASQAKAAALWDSRCTLVGLGTWR